MTLLDRPYRRLVDDLPLRYVGFTVPDELFAGYGLGLDERWRACPTCHVVAGELAASGRKRRSAAARRGTARAGGDASGVALGSNGRRG